MTTPSVVRTQADETIHTLAKHRRDYMPFGREWNLTALPFCISGLATPVVINFCLGPREKYLNLGTALILCPILITLVRIGIEGASEWRLMQNLRALFRRNANPGWKSVSTAAIPSLLEILPYATGDRSGLLPRLVALLNRLLKSLRAEDAMLLTKEQRDVLHELIMPIRQDVVGIPYVKELSEAQRYELRPTVVGVLAFVGSGNSIPVLERLAAATDDADLRQSALQSVEQIRERMHHNPEEMLRASIAPAPADMLLRAATSPSPHNRDPRQLLRAATPRTPPSQSPETGLRTPHK